ncbi:MAG: helix-turn-helix transcriptional regulator [Thermomicrobiales bacterium]|nr:helix-turn-helix transcriptional regulator [Thermomicrobiales bacterium]
MSDDARKGTRRRRGTSAVSLGQWLRRERLNQQLSQTELAARANLSRSYVCNIERGYDIQPSIDALDRLGAALSVSRSEILAAAGILEPAGGLPADDRDARLMTLLRSLTPDDRDAVERFARFLQSEERRWNQPRLLEEDDPSPIQEGPTLFDALESS